MTTTTAFPAADEAALRQEIVALGASLFQRGLTSGSSGNISVRLADGWLMTPTNASLGSLDASSLSRLDERGEWVAGDVPTKEAPLHMAMYASRTFDRAVVHLHATYSAAVSCLEGLDPHDCLPPLTAYHVMRVGAVPLLPYHRPGDAAIAPLVQRLACRHCAVLLANHGPVVSGRSLQNAVHAVEELEQTARLFLLTGGRRTRPLDAGQVADLEQRFGRTGQV